MLHLQNWFPKYFHHAFPVSAQKPLDKVVTAEFFLVKMSPKKRKDSETTLMHIPIGTTEVAINPSDDHPPSKASALSIPLDVYNLTNGQHMKTCTLFAKIHFTPISQVMIVYVCTYLRNELSKLLKFALAKKLHFLFTDFLLHCFSEKFQ